MTNALHRYGDWASFRDDYMRAEFFNARVDF